jgi:hypothetical protein
MYAFVTGFRLYTFIVGLTNASPNLQPPVINGYIQCGQRLGLATDGPNISVNCLPDLPASRYVIIMVSNVVPMSICELEVYGTGLITIFCNGDCIMVVFYEQPV